MDLTTSNPYIQSAVEVNYYLIEVQHAFEKTSQL